MDFGQTVEGSMIEATSKSLLMTDSHVRKATKASAKTRGYNIFGLA